jgi:hypothetical protein
MAGFTIPNTPDAYNTNQAEPDSLDFQVLGDQSKGVISGMDVTLNANGVVNVAAGEILIGGVHYSCSATTVNLSAYTTAPFFDIIVARVTGASAAPALVSGSALTSNPRYPAITDASDVVLAAVWRDSSPTSASHITDKRLLLRPTPTRVTATSPAGGATGDLFVNSNWSTGTNGATNMDSALSVKVGASFFNIAQWPSDNTITTTGSITGGSLSAGTGAITGGSLNVGVGAITAGTVTANLTGTATKASTLAQNGGAGTGMTFTYTPQQGGQPTYVWGTNNGTTINAYNPSNFSVDTATALDDGAGAVIWAPANSTWLVDGNLDVFYNVDVYGDFTTGTSNVYFPFLGTTTSSANARILADGRLAYNTSIRDIKQNIQPLNEGINLIKNLRPRTFSAKPTTEDTFVDDFVRENVPTFGFIVDEIEEDCPHLLDYVLDKDTNDVKPIMWKTNDLIAILTKAVQELLERIEILEAKK